MPCTDGGYSEERWTREQQDRLDAYARMLCALCRRFEDRSGKNLDDFEAMLEEGSLAPIIDTIPGLRAWWKQHQKDDARRERERVEQARSALAKARTTARKAAEALRRLENEGGSLEPANGDPFVTPMVRGTKGRDTYDTLRVMGKTFTLRKNKRFAQSRVNRLVWSDRYNAWMLT